MRNHAVFSMDLKTLSKRIVEYCICAICTIGGKCFKMICCEMMHANAKNEGKIAGRSAYFGKMKGFRCQKKQKMFRKRFQNIECFTEK